MGAGGGVALKFLQMFIRVIQFCCAALILSLYSYFLATLHNHNLPIDTYLRAVEGISGVAVVYTAVAILLVCCLAGFAATSGIAILLDIAFVGAFIYVAQANRGGASRCNGIVSTPFGTGPSDSQISQDDGHGGFTVLPNQHQACQMLSAVLAVSIVAIFFFIFSAIIEVALIRHRRKEHRFGPSPANGYTEGYAKKRRGFGFRRNKKNTGLSGNDLPEHTHPNQLNEPAMTQPGATYGDGVYNRV